MVVKQLKTCFCNHTPQELSVWKIRNDAICPTPPPKNKDKLMIKSRRDCSIILLLFGSLKHSLLRACWNDLSMSHLQKPQGMLPLSSFTTGRNGDTVSNSIRCHLCLSGSKSSAGGIMYLSYIQNKKHSFFPGNFSDPYILEKFIHDIFLSENSVVSAFNGSLWVLLISNTLLILST